MLLRIEHGGFRNKVYRTLGGLFVPMFDAFVPRYQNVLAVLCRPDGKLLIPASNIVTDAGDIHYAEKGAGEVVTNVFGVLELASAGTPGKAADRSSFTVIGSTEKAHDGGYPQTNDVDADNTGSGADVTSYLTSYTKADFNAASITHGLITNATPGASEPILTGYAFSAGFAKTADDTLKVFTNHTFNGV